MKNKSNLTGAERERERERVNSLSKNNTSKHHKSIFYKKFIKWSNTFCVLSISTLGCLIASQHYNKIHILTSQNKASECNLHSINHPLSSNNNDIEGFAEASKFIKGSKTVAGTIHYSIAEGTNDLTIINTEDVIAENPEFLGDIYLNDFQIEPYKLIYLGENSSLTLQPFHFSGKLTLPSTLLEIRNYFFQACNVTSIDLSKCNKLQTISTLSFASNPITKIDLSNCSSLTTIGQNAFNGCKDLTSISLSNSIDLIKSYAFTNCPITNLELNGNNNFSLVTSDNGKGHILLKGGGITEWDYQTSPVGCLAYGDIDMSKATDLLEIKANLFFGCGGVTSVNLPNSITTIKSYAFRSCSRLTAINLSNCTSLTTIGGSAFQGCTKLTSISLPSSLTSIGQYAFGGCPIKQVNFESNNTYKWVNNVGQGHLLSTSNEWDYQTSPVGCLAWGDFNDLSWLDGETTMPSIFQRCGGITSVTLPDSITTISNDCFFNCESLQSINLDKISDFGTSSFYNCTNLNSIVFGNQLSMLSASTFALCSKLKSITFNWNDEELSQLDSTKYSNLWLKNAVGENNMKNVTVYVPKGLVDTYERARTALGIENCKIEEMPNPKPTPTPINNLPLILGLSLGLGIPALAGIITGTVIGVKNHKGKK